MLAFLKFVTLLHREEDRIDVLWLVTYRVSFSQLGALRETFGFLLLVFPLFEKCGDVLLMGA